MFGLKFSASMLLAFDSAADASPGEVASFSSLSDGPFFPPVPPEAVFPSSTGLLGSATTVEGSALSKALKST
jgi:hypothetical protein